MRLRDILIVIIGSLSTAVAAQSVEPTASYLTEQGTVDKWENISGQAPLEVSFRANPTGMGDHTPAYEWHFSKKGATEELLVRYEEDTSYRFMESGTFVVTLKTRLTDSGADLGDK